MDIPILSPNVTVGASILKELFRFDFQHARQFGDAVQADARTTFPFQALKMARVDIQFFGQLLLRPSPLLS